MPSRNAVKQFEDDTSYHCYNRGVEQRMIFMDAQDYGVFLNRLKLMLSEPGKLREEYPHRQLIKSYYGRIELRAYCLMPNHFHLLLYQHDAPAISEFMSTLGTSYTMYFNKRYERVGHLFQGRYKARKIDTDSYNLHISRYIHLNPCEVKQRYDEYPYSSMRFLIRQDIRPDWLNVGRILEDFDGSITSYIRFVDEYASRGKYNTLHDLYGLN